MSFVWVRGSDDSKRADHIVGLFHVISNTLWDTFPLNIPKPERDHRTFRVRSSHPLSKLAKLLNLDGTRIPWMPDNTGFIANVDTRRAAKKLSLGQWLAVASAAARQEQRKCHFAATNLQFGQNFAAINRGSRQSKRASL